MTKKRKRVQLKCTNCPHEINQHGPWGCYALANIDYCRCNKTPDDIAFAFAVKCVKDIFPHAEVIEEAFHEQTH